MSDTKITGLTLASPAMSDVIPFVDVSDTMMGPDGSTRKATIDSLPFVKTEGISTENPSILASKPSTGVVFVEFTQVGLIAVTEAGSAGDIGVIPVLPPSLGGTGSDNVSDARTNLGLGTASVLNVPDIGSDASSIEVVLGSDTRLTNARTPVFHSHSWSEITSKPTTLAEYGLTDVSGTGQIVLATSPTLIAPVLTGVTVFRKTGGTAGTQEVQISHDGVNAIIQPKTGSIRFKGANSEAFISTGIEECSYGLVGGTSILTGLSTITLRSFNISFGPFDGYTRMTLNSAGVMQFTAAPGIGSNLPTFAFTPVSPTQITANQNNYNPGTSRYYRLTTDASRTITGLSISQLSGQECEIWNVGSNNLVLAHQSTSSTAANRFISVSGADVTIAPEGIALLRYDGVSSRWRVGKLQ